MSVINPKSVAGGTRVVSRQAKAHKHRPKVGRGQYIKAPLLRDKLTKPRWQANAIVNNPGNALAIGGIGTGAGVLASTRKPVSKADARQKKEAAGGALVGGGAGHLARVGADYGAKATAERQFKPMTTKGNYGPYTDSPHKAGLNKYKRTLHGDVRAKAKAFDEGFPKGVPSYRARKLGTALNKKPVVAAAVLGTAAIGAGIGANHKVKKNMSTSAFGIDHGEIAKFDSKVALLGGPFSAVSDAPKGKKKQAYKDSYGPSIKGSFKGLGAGGAGGAGVGAAIGGAIGRGEGAKLGAMAGGGLGAVGGQAVGAYKGGVKGRAQAKKRGKY